MIKAVIFDVDGVIFDTEHKRFKDLRKILKKYHLVLEPSTFKQMVGRKSEAFVKDIFPKLCQADCKAIAQERRELQYHNIKMGRLIKGVPELLRYLKLEGYKVAASSGSRRFIVDRLLGMYLLKRYFDVVVTGEDYSSSKPNPECFKVTLKRLGVKPKEAIVIEDAVHGIQAAKKAGCKAFGIETYLSPKDFKGADKTFASHADILTYFKTKRI